LEEREGARRTEKTRVVDQTASMAERASTPLNIFLSDPQGRDEAVAQEGAQNSVKKGLHFGTHRSRVSVHASHEALTLHFTRRSPWLALLARCECLKRHGVGEREGELGADFTAIVLPSPSWRAQNAGQLSRDGMSRKIVFLSHTVASFSKTGSRDL
jgi:hypothetical protein